MYSRSFQKEREQKAYHHHPNFFKKTKKQEKQIYVDIEFLTILFLRCLLHEAVQKYFKLK